MAGETTMIWFLLFVIISVISPTYESKNYVGEKKIERNLSQQNCCDGTCCDISTEECCPDKTQGGVCCILQTSFCCPPLGGNPSRCCPRWMVCCEAGRFGCCEPGELFAKTYTAYALFDESNWDGSSTMYGMKIDTSTASKTQMQVNGFDDYGEATRVFLFDPKSILFYLLRANFSHPGFDGTEPITLHIIDPLKGTTTNTSVTGASGLVTGMFYNFQIQKIQFATYKWINNRKVGYNFYVIDPKGTGVAKLVSTYNFQQDDWTGWFRKVSNDGNTIYRLGYRDVITSSDFGIGLTDISGQQATTQWIDNFTVPDGFGFYQDLNTNGNDFYSLAEDYNGDLNLVYWNLAGDSKVIANLGDAHETRFFGPISSSLSQDATKYYAMVVYDGIIPIETDRWALSVVDLSSGTAVTTPITPWMIAGTDGLSGFGIVDSTQHILDQYL